MTLQQLRPLLRVVDSSPVGIDISRVTMYSFTVGYIEISVTCHCLLRGVRLQRKLTEAWSTFHLMNKPADSKTTFKFLDAKELVKRIRAKPELF